MNTDVSMKNTKACNAPTKISNKKKGNVATPKVNAVITVNKTSPANTFPNKRNENEIIFPSSETVSSIPTMKLIGLEKLIYFFKYWNFNTPNPRIFVNTTERIASETVIERSLVGGLNKCASSLKTFGPSNVYVHSASLKHEAAVGIWDSPSGSLLLVSLESSSDLISPFACSLVSFVADVSIIVLCTIGVSPNQLETRISTKNVNRNPNNLFAYFSLIVSLHRLKSASTTNSSMIWSFVGFVYESFALKKNIKAMIISTTKKHVKRVLVISKPAKLKITSGFNEIFII